jgi:GTP-binding protein HflX
MERPGQKGSAAVITLTENVYELEMLAESAGFKVEFEVIQRKTDGNSPTFLGKGKFESLKDLLLVHPVDVILINGNLKPKQHFNLENTLKIECLDRIGLVLLIFAEKARDKKARLQVEKARLEYEIPLLREWIHSAKMGEHPGFLGSGEYQVDVYYDLVKRRTRKISEELSAINLGEDIRRKHRRGKGFFLVGIAGYTNAGKSSLLNRLTGERVVVEDRMFSTLSITTRRLSDVKKKILISDTIGFIQDLPHFMIESFMTTIEDLYLSDLILLVIDSSDPIDLIQTKFETSRKILLPEISPNNIMIILNKTDLDPIGADGKLEKVRELLPGAEALSISLVLNQGVDTLLGSIVDFFRYGCIMNFSIPNTSDSQPFISHLYDISDVTSIEYDTNINISIECRDKDLQTISRSIIALDGCITTIDHRENSHQNELDEQQISNYEIS